MKDKDKNDSSKSYKNGMLIGATSAALGAGSYGYINKAEKELKNLPKDEVDRLIKKYKLDKSLKSGKKVGLSLVALGVPLAGYSAYKHYKNKKKEDDNNS